jgi:hypothetical protein
MRDPLGVTPERVELPTPLAFERSAHKERQR